MWLEERPRLCKLLFPLRLSAKAWPSRGDSIGMDAPFSTAKDRSGGNLQAGLVKPTSSRWESPGGKELSLLHLLITLLLCVKKRSECQTFRHQEKTQWFFSHRCAGVKQMNLVVSGIGSDLWQWSKKNLWGCSTCSCQYLQLHSFWPNQSLSLSLSLCKFSTILRHFNHMSNSQIFALVKSLFILVQTWIKRYLEWLNHPAQMFPAVKEFKSFQWHSSSHTYPNRTTLRHTDLQHLPHPSFAPRKLHHPTPLEIPPAGCLSTAAADFVVAEDKLLQAAVFFEAFRQGLAVSGRQHRDGRPFFYGQGTGTDPGEIYRWGSSNQHQADGNHQAVGNYHV